jgi:hypothetical protein
MYRTFDQLYPTNHGFYGISDYVGWRNISAWRLSARSRADRRWSAAVDLHHFALADSRDFWYGDNGRPVTGASGTALRDAAGLSGRDVGREFDAVVRYTARKGLAIEAGYARFWPGGFVRKTNGGRADSSNWFYLQTLCAL